MIQLMMFDFWITSITAVAAVGVPYDLPHSFQWQGLIAQ